MSNYAEHALTKLNEDRLGKQTFCDYFIKTETREFPVHKCLLGVMSGFFRGMFETEMTEKYQNFWDAKEFQPGIIDAILNFLYGLPSSITQVNVHHIVEAADYLQIPKLLEYCMEFISTSLSEKNLFRNWQHAKQYRLENLIDMCRKFAAEHFLALSRSSEVLSLELEFFEEFLETRSSTAIEERVYETIISWINFDRETRSTYFGKLFDKIDLDQIPKSFINIEISSNELVLENPIASKKLLLAMRKHFLSEASDQTNRSSSKSSSLEGSKTVVTSEQDTKLYSKSKPPAPQKTFSSIQVTGESGRQTILPLPSSVVTAWKCRQAVQIKPPSTEFVLVGGITSSSYTRKYNTETQQWSRLADIDDVCIEGQLALFKSLLYYIGGRLANDLNSYTDVSRLNIKSLNPDWIPCSPMLQKRHRFGCVVFKNRIFVAGGRAHKTEFLRSVESYELYKNVWKEEPDMNHSRAGCGLVEYQGLIHAIGGQVQNTIITNTMEVLVSNRWILSGNAMNFARSDCAVAAYNNKIYVAGGMHGESYLSVAEMFSNGKWTNISSMSIPRAGHGACVIGDKIYVAGGENISGAVKAMQILDPELNRWEIIGEIKGDPIGVAMVAL